ncbi:MAG: hypothetical protein HY914_03140 [Desulfomonile tiedjei]|nr:hypothetical protein [Desulfomonile tiedjei]
MQALRMRKKSSGGNARRVACLMLLTAAACILGCQLVPNRPDAVFALYRDRMKKGNLSEARTLLTEESRNLAVSLESSYKLEQTPEDLALLNALDPVSPPTILQTTDTLALLQVRTLKGGNNVVRLLKKEPSDQWHVDLRADLNSFRSFLEARRALDSVREQAGDFASTWKAFNERLDTLGGPAFSPEGKPPVVGASKDVKKESKTQKKGPKRAGTER